MITHQGYRPGVVLKKFVLGAHPIIKTFMDELKIGEIIASYIKQDRRLKVRVEKTLTVLIHNVLTAPMPLYEMADWLAPVDGGAVGLEPWEADCIHDDRVGRALEVFYRGRHKDVFFHLALRAIKVAGLECSRIHQDTTTVSFCGRYEGWGLPEAIGHGTNKDHRPDLKQLVLGLSVTADGSVPLAHQVYPGNQTDDRLHVDNHRRLRKLLGRSDFIYVADCKLATEENLRRITACGGRFVSVMPRTWREDGIFRQRVRQGKVEWKHLVSRRNNRKPDSRIDRYDLACGEYHAKGFRLVWIRSTQKAEQDRETRRRRIEKGLEAVRELETGLNRYQLKGRTAIDRAIRKRLKECQAEEWIWFEIHGHRTYQRRYEGRGRPTAGKKSLLSWKQHFTITFGIDEEAVETASLTDGIFPLITNLGEDYSAKRILEIYKFQPFLEKRHSQLNTWQEVTPVLLKRDERVVAYLHMHVMALMVATLIERKLRKAMKERSLTSLPLYPEGRACAYPTLFDILRLFRGVERYEMVDGERVTVFPARLTPVQRQILDLLDVPASLYH